MRFVPYISTSNRSSGTQTGSSWPIHTTRDRENMASIFSRRPVLATATTFVAIGSLYYVSRPRPQLLQSGHSTPMPTLSLPKNMLFSKQLRVTSVEQVNHDTKRIIFALPGGKDEISGVTPGAAILTQHTPDGGWFPVFRYAGSTSTHRSIFFYLIVYLYLGCS